MNGRLWAVGKLCVLLFIIGSFVGCGDPPTDGSLRIDFNNLATRSPFTELDFSVARVELFYGAAPPAPGEDGGDCDFPGATVITTEPVAVTVDLTQIGDSFVGAFFAPPGHISEIRLVSD